MSLPIKLCEDMPNMMLDTIIFIKIAKSNQTQLTAQNIPIQRMSTQIKVQTQFIRELVAVTKESLDKKPTAVEVEVYRDMVPCFINIMKPKLESSDVE